MRCSSTLLLVASILASSSVVAMADTSRDLGPLEVRAGLTRVDSAIGACYLGTAAAAGGTGKLELVLTIHRKGLLDHIGVRAPGLPAKAVSTIDGCVREALAGITFPARRVGTTAIVPYFWQKTAAVGAGPQASCWDAKGCSAAVTSGRQPSRGISDHQARRPPRG